MDRDELANKSTKELLEMFKANARALATAVESVFGDQPVPDPRAMIESIEAITPEAWINTFLNEESREEMRKQMPLMKAMTQVNNENMLILQRMVRLIQA